MRFCTIFDDLLSKKIVTRRQNQYSFVLSGNNIRLMMLRNTQKNELLSFLHLLGHLERSREISQMK